MIFANRRKRLFQAAFIDPRQTHGTCVPGELTHFPGVALVGPIPSITQGSIGRHRDLAGQFGEFSDASFDLVASPLFCQLFQPAGGFGETVKSDGATRALEPMRKLRQRVEVRRFQRGLHFGESFVQSIDKDLDDLPKLGQVHRQGGSDRGRCLAEIEAVRLRAAGIAAGTQGFARWTLQGVGRGSQ